MIRLVVIAALVVLVSVVVVQAVRWIKYKRVDWNGVALAVGFVALAFYLRHATGMG